MTWNQPSPRNPLQFSQCLAWFSIVYWKTCFWVSLAHPMVWFLSHLVKNSIYEMVSNAMCASWLCPLNKVSKSKTRTHKMLSNVLYHAERNNVNANGVFRNRYWEQVALWQTRVLSPPPCSSHHQAPSRPYYPVGIKAGAHVKTALTSPVADLDFQLKRGPDFILLAQLVFLPSLISSFFAQNKGEAGGPRPFP